MRGGSIGFPGGQVEGPFKPGHGDYRVIFFFSIDIIALVRK